MRERLAEARQEAESPYGDIWAYRRSLDEVRARRRGRDDLVAVGLARLRPGEVVHASKGRYRGPVAVIASAHRKGGMRLTTITKRGDRCSSPPTTSTTPPVGTVRLPTVFNPNRADYRREVGAHARQRQLRGAGNGRRRRDDHDGTHPVEADPNWRCACGRRA